MKDNRIDRALRQAQNFNNFAGGKIISEETTARTLVKIRNNKKLYLEGYRAGLLGERTLESFTELIVDNGKTIPLCEQRNFYQGYLKGQRELESKTEQNKTGLSR